jgi:hypothetical protein
MKLNSFLNFFGALLFLGLVCPVNSTAVPTLYCNSGPGINLVSTGCISGESRSYPNGGDGVYTNAGGGDPEGAVEQAILDATGTAVDLTLYGKSDDNPTLFLFTPNSGGSLILSQDGSWNVVNGTLISYITIKAANSFALFQVSPASSMGVYSTLGILNNGGNRPTVSHISFWTAPTHNTQVPEPASSALFLAGMGFMSWRRKRNA